MYREQGVVVWAIAAEEHDDFSLAAFVEDFDIQMPVLVDEDGSVRAQYVVDSTVPAGAYPEEWIVGTDGNIAYRTAEYDHDEMVAIIEAELRGE